MRKAAQIQGKLSRRKLYKRQENRDLQASPKRRTARGHEASQERFLLALATAVGSGEDSGKGPRRKLPCLRESPEQFTRSTLWKQQRFGR